MTKEKLIKQYKEKIEQCDKYIIAYTESIRQARKEKEDEETIRGFAEGRKFMDTTRQAYIQIVKDLEDLE